MVEKAVLSSHTDSFEDLNLSRSAGCAGPTLNLCRVELRWSAPELGNRLVFLCSLPNGRQPLIHLYTIQNTTTKPSITERYFLMSVASTPIRLYSYPTSPYAQKVGCYLKYKQLDYELVGVNPMTNAEIRFTQQRRVPVLKIGDEWRLESSELGLWLDELYPENPIMPADTSAKAEILSIDRWVSDSVIPAHFRRAVEWENPIHSIQNGWKLARAVHDATPLQWYARVIWPFAVRRAPFIVHMIRGMDLRESIADQITRLQKEFVEHLQGGPFFAGQSKPTLADLSAFPVVVSGHLMGMKTRRSLLDNPDINSWSKRVQSHLPDNPLLVPDRLLARVRI